MKKFLSILMVVMLLCAMLPTALADGETTAPAVATTAVSNVTATTATLNGTLTAGSENQLPYAVGFSISPTSAINDATAHQLETVAAGNLSFDVTGLTPNTSYTYSVYYYPTQTSTSADVVWAPEAKSFTTLADVTTGSYLLVSTAAENNVLYANVTINGSTTSTGAKLYMEYKADGATEWTRTSALTATAEGKFSATVKLEAAKAYTYRAVADNTEAGGNVRNGEEKTISLQVAPSIVNNGASGVTTNAAALKATVTAGTSTISKVGFMYRAAGTEAFTSIETTFGTNGAYSLSLTGLKVSTTYEFYPYVTIDGVNYPAQGDATLSTFTTKTVLSEPLNPDDYLNYNNQKYIIYASAGTGGTISPSGSTAVKSGEAVPFYIEAKTGYKLTDVLVDNQSVGAVSSYLFTDVKANHTIYATFEKTATSNPTPTPGGSTVIVPPTGVEIPYALSLALMGSGLLLALKKRK